MTMEPQQRRNIIEGALLAAAEPLSLVRLIGLFEEEQDEEENGSKVKAEVLTALEEIREQCEGRGFELKEVASGWRFQVRPETAPWVNRLWEEKPQKYSRAILETLALVAYRQPITRGDIEEIRGVAVSSHIIKSLTERDWIKVVGHRDVPGRPSLYATTRQFLDYFNLKSLDELPSLGEIRDLDEINSMLDLDGRGSASASDQESSDEESDLHPDQEGSEDLEEGDEQQDTNLEAESETETESSTEGRSDELVPEEDTLASVDFWSAQSEPSLDGETDEPSEESGEEPASESSESDTDQSSSATSDADDQEPRSA